MMKMSFGGGLRVVYGSSIATKESRFARSRVVHGFRFVSSRSSAGLLGPPEIHSDLHKTSVNYVVSPFYASSPLTGRDSEKPCLSLFHGCIGGYLQNQYRMDAALERSWTKDPLTTLRLIGHIKLNTRSRNSKHGRQHFYNAALWLHTHHPKTLAGNLKAFSKLGSLKDWPELLHRLVRGPFVREADMLQRTSARRAKSMRIMEKKSGKKSSVPISSHFYYYDSDTDTDKTFDLDLGSKEERRIRQARQAVKMYRFDPCYRSLHDSVSDLFAELLKSDLKYLDAGEPKKLSWASKWCPSLGSSYDRSTLLCESIARRIFPYDEPSYVGIEEAHYAYRVRDRLRKQVLVPLRRALELPETYMSNNKWHLLPYEHVKSTAMRAYKRLFMKHNGSRFVRYLRRQRHDRVSLIRGGEALLLPHEICRLLYSGYDREEDVEEKWRKMVETFSREGKFKNCIVACEEMHTVGRSRHDFSLSFQLLASELSDAPWNGKILVQTGDSVPGFVKTQGDDLRSKMQCLAMSTSSDLLCVGTLLDHILEAAVCGEVSREKMVKRVFFISSHVCQNYHDMSIDEMRKKYEQCGYVMPDLVYWGLGFGSAGDDYVDVSSDCDGSTRIEGFSASCCRVFMENDGKVEEDVVMEAEISGEEYKELKVLD